MRPTRVILFWKQLIIIWMLIIPSVVAAQLNVQALYEANFLSPDATNAWIEAFNDQYAASKAFSDIGFLNAFGMGLSYSTNGTHLSVLAKKRFNRNTAENVVIGEVTNSASFSYSMNAYTGNFDFDLSAAIRFGMECSLYRMIHRFRYDNNRIDNRITNNSWGYGAHLNYYYKSNSESGFIIQIFGESIDGYTPDFQFIDATIPSFQQKDMINFGIRLIFTNGRQPF